MHFVASHVANALLGVFYVGDLAVAAFFLSSSQYGQALLAILVAVVGFVLNRKANKIHVLVNSRMTDAVDRIAALEHKLGLEPGEAIPGPQIVTSTTPREST